jgi:hypothetical protein
MSDEPKVESAAAPVSSESAPARADGIAAEGKDHETEVNTNGHAADETVTELPAAEAKGM